MKRILLFLQIVVCTFSLSAQQVPLRGVVTVQNSRVNTGKTVYVPGVEVKHEKANPTLTDNEGKFTLKVVGVPTGKQITLSALPTGKYKGYVVVNERDLNSVTLGRTEQVGVFICSKEELDKRKADLVGINMKKYQEASDRKIAELNQRIKKLEAANDYANELYQKTMDSLTNITNDRSETLKRVKEYAESMVLINLDEAGETYVKAYQYFERGELDSVTTLLKRTLNYDARLKSIRDLQAEASQDLEAARLLEETGEKKSANAAQQQKILMEECLLLARTHSMQFNHREAMKNYEQAIQADRTNLDNVFEYANYLINIQEYLMAEEYYLSFLDGYEQLSATSQDVNLPDLGDVLNNLGICYHYRKQFLLAQKQYLRCLEIYEELYKTNPQVYLPDLAMILKNLGVNYLAQKNYPEAGKHLLRCLEIYEELYKSNSQFYLPNLVNILELMAKYYHDQKNYPEAAKYSKRCYLIYEEINFRKRQKYRVVEHHARQVELFQNFYRVNPDEYQEKLVNALGNLSFYSLFVVEYSQSVRSALQALKYAPEKHWIKKNLAHALLLLGRYDDAEKVYKELIALDKPSGGDKTYAESCLKDFEFLQKAIPYEHLWGMWKIKIKTFAESCLEDFGLLEKEGAIPPEHKQAVEKIKTMLQKK